MLNLVLQFYNLLVCWSSQLVLTCFSPSQCNCSATGMENTTAYRSAVDSLETTKSLIFIENKEKSYEGKSEWEIDV